MESIIENAPTESHASLSAEETSTISQNENLSDTPQDDLLHNRQNLHALITNSLETNYARVAFLKEALHTGLYSINSADIAQKMLAESG